MCLQFALSCTGCRTIESRAVKVISVWRREGSLLILGLIFTRSGPIIFTATLLKNKREIDDTVPQKTTLDNDERKTLQKLSICSKNQVSEDSAF